MSCSYLYMRFLEQNLKLQGQPKNWRWVGEDKFIIIDKYSKVDDFLNKYAKR